MSVKKLRKLTHKTFEPKNGSYMRIYGLVTQAVAKETQYGSATMFVGHFEAVDLESGDVVSSHKMYLPSSGDEILKARLAESDVAEFSFEISREPDPTIPMGFYYACIDLLDSTLGESESVLEKLRRATSAARSAA